MLELFIVGELMFKQPVVNRTNHELCMEVAYEMNAQVDIGMVSRAKADSVIERCFSRFAK